MEQLSKKIQALIAECEKFGETHGEKAMEIISDYPLYVGGTSNISYGEAILIALMYGDIDKQLQDGKDLDRYFATLKDGEKASVEGFEEWKKKLSKKS